MLVILIRYNKTIFLQGINIIIFLSVRFSNLHLKTSTTLLAFMRKGITSLMIILAYGNFTHHTTTSLIAWIQKKNSLRFRFVSGILAVERWNDNTMKILKYEVWIARFYIIILLRIFLCGFSNFFVNYQFSSNKCN